MGIRHLQRFMKENVPNGFEEVSIVDECRQYQRNHDGEKPKLVFDLMNMTSLLNMDKVEVLYGGRSGKYWQMIDSLFRRLSEVAQLVFFADGGVVPTKYELWIRRQKDNYQKCVRIIDLVYAQTPIADIVNSLNENDIPRLNNNSSITKQLAKTYGTLTVSVATECDLEMVKYASKNPSVLAILSDDSDFLIYRGQWRLFSIKELDMETLKTREFSRTALRQHLRLNDSQMMILSTIAGNDVIKYDEVRAVHQEYFRPQVACKFPAIARMIRFEISKDSYQDILYNLADFLFEDHSDSSVQRIHESINQYNDGFEPNDEVNNSDDESDLLQFCLQKDYNSVYRIVSKLPKNLTLDYYDFRRDDWPNFAVIRRELFERQVGIILKHRRPSQNQDQIYFEIYTKEKHDQGHQQSFVKPSYPDIEVPSLLQLLNRPEFPELDEIRFKLLKWSISDTLADVDLSAVINPYLANVLSLYLMVEKKFISVHEADLILLSVKNVELNTIPDDLIIPPVVNERAFRIVFIFFKFVGSVGKSMATSGLKHLRHPTNFDGVFFHNAYLDGNSPVSSLRDIDHYRIYKNL